MPPRPPGPGYRALRRGRVSQTGQYYLVTTATHQRRPLFHDLRAGRCVVRALQTLEPLAETKCYVIMPDHLHWLLKLRGGTTLSAAVQRVKAGSARAITARAPHLRPGWQGGFHDHAVRREDELRALARYVVANPLRAGLVERIGEYPLWDAVWVEDGRGGG